MKKKLLLMIMVLGIALVCVACKGTGVEPSAGPDFGIVDSEPLPEPDIGILEPEPLPEPDIDVSNMRELSLQEINWFAFEFFCDYLEGSAERAMANCFLIPEYHSAEEVNLVSVFGSGLYQEIDITWDEIEQLEIRYGVIAREEDIIKLPVEAMDRVLKKYLNISFSEANKEGMEQWYFMEEYNSYYYVPFMVNHSENVEPSFEKGYAWEKDNGDILLRYELTGYDYISEYRYVTLRKVDGRYIFIDNTFAGSGGDSGEEKDTTMKEMSADRLSFFKYSFFNNANRPMTNMFLTSEYDSPLDIDMGMLFYNGIAGGSGYQATDEERQLLIERYDAEIWGDCVRIPVSMINEVLNRYIKMPLDKTHKVGLSFYYLEEYDAYYSLATDTMGFSLCNIIEGWENEAGTIILRYEIEEKLGVYREVVLHEENGNYYFVANYEP